MSNTFLENRIDIGSILEPIIYIYILYNIEHILNLL